jgi:hypothetical protein
LACGPWICTFLQHKNTLVQCPYKWACDHSGISTVCTAVHLNEPHTSTSTRG